MGSAERGFTAVELISIIVVVAVIAVSLVSIAEPSSKLQLQQSRDDVVAALFAAQQLAMSRMGPVVVETGGTHIDIRHDGNSVTIGGIRYPLALAAKQKISRHIFDYDRLGKIKNVTDDVAILISQPAGSTVTINVSVNGFSR